MKVKFWLGTYGLDPAASATGSTAEPMLSTDVSALAIEVIEYEDPDNIAVLLSTLTDPKSPGQLECRIGFANGAKASNDWRDRGFPLVDAVIVREQGDVLRVKSPYFAPNVKEMQYEKDILRIQGVRFNAGGKTSKAFITRYDQSQDAPDYLSPATSIMRKPVHWALQRSNVKRVANIALDLGPTVTRCPNLIPLKVGPLKLTSVWTGFSDIPDRPLSGDDAQLRRLSRADTFGVPAFRFDNVDIVGFRIDLDAIVSDYGDKLDRLIEPLNFHLASAPIGGPDGRRNGITDFRYLPATSTLIIELLRYGKMRLKSPDLPLQIEDYQSQHELLVRVLVGRIDDDTTQAHDPAVFVPAIFVDNPWSKILGREVQGFDKHLANFCVYQNDKLTALRPDGRVSDTTPQRPLVDVRRIDLVRTSGSQAASASVPILNVDYPPGVETNRDAFDSIDLELALGGSSLSLTRWRQSDFADAEFRRSFARSAVKRTLKGFRSIQVAPVGERVGALDKTWITGTFAVDDTVRMARPAGVANLTVHNEPTAPEGWRLLCDLFGIPSADQRTFSFPTGSWYQMQCSMDLTIDNGLD